VSGRAGLQYGVKAGPGVFFIDGRFIMDLGASSLVKSGGGTVFYERYTVNLSIGYKYGIIQRW
jgi:hypothetical protein